MKKEKTVKKKLKGKGRDGYIYEEEKKEDWKELIPKYKRSGYTDRQIFKKIGYTKDVIYRWFLEDPTFKALFKHNIDTYLVDLEESVRRRALGFTKETKKIRRVYKIDPDGKKILKEQIEEYQTMYVWSDANAMHLLKKLMPKKYGDEVVQSEEAINYTKSVKEIEDKIQKRLQYDK